MDAWLIPLAALICALVAEAAIRYAHRRRLLDQPGRRRSHVLPTPRGGGIGIVVAATVVLALALRPAQPLPAVLLMPGLLLVAGIGWWDDHRPLRALTRLAVHLAAGVLLAAALWFWTAGGDATGGWAIPRNDLPVWAGLALAAVIVFGAAWSINLHNFMDGINGLLTAQSAFVFAMIALVGALGLPHGLGSVPAALAAACLAFLPFNFPFARIFLGDVGSGALGFLIAALLACAVVAEPHWLAVGLLLVSGFAVDATATLLQRIWRGRRWYSAHREHLYQWLVRSGCSHARVVGYYMAWNLLLVAPLAVLVALKRDAGLDVAAVLVAYAAGVALWWRARQSVLAGARRHA
ncbi:glycosyl transferase family 4 [Tahibacter sp. UC22_41]|uniref:glycosyl transferase family 4 n=1 Tax=Tahibacter sp. UC22_41 TaxID=3350178 RepID=UPI0036DF69B8